MRIAILGSRGIPASYGGFETFAEHISIGLVQAGHDVRVYCPSYHSYKERTYKGVTLVKIPCADDLLKNRVLRAIANLFYDILSLIHVTFTRAEIVYMLGYASGPAILIPKISGKKIVINPDGLEWKSKRWGLGPRSWLYFCEMVSARLSDQLIADAQPIKDHFKERYGVEAACIPYGADLQPLSIEASLQYNKGHYYLAVARMVPETSIPLLVRGFKLSGTDKRLIIIGPVADGRFFDSEIAPLLEENRVIYLGPIYDRNLLQTYRTHAFSLLHGHASDGTNPSLLESMACASPIIAINTASNLAVLGINEGFYFTNEDELAQCIQRLDSFDSDALQILGQTNKATIQKKFSWSLVVERHLKVFQAIQHSAPK